MRFEPGETKTVDLVTIAGKQVIRGGNSIASGPVGDEGRVRALNAVRDKHFQHQEDQ